MKKESPLNVKKINIRIHVFFFILCFLIYGKSIRNDYSMDDEFVIKNNKQVQQGIKAIPEIFSSRYVINSRNSSYEYRPIVKAVYALEYEVFGLNPHLSHFFNVLLYAISISLLYFLLRQLFADYSYVFSFLVAVIFLLHPLHSEVVLSIKNRDVIFSFTGVLLALYFYIKSVEKGKSYMLFLGAFFMLFALMSKKDAVTYFAVIPFSLWYLKSVPLKKMTWIFVSFAAVVFTFRMFIQNAAQATERRFLEWENPLYQDTTVWERIPTGLYCIWFYLKIFLLPYPLISYYGYNQVPISTWSDPVVWIVLIGLAFTGYLVINNFKRRKILVFGILYFLITISMFTNILVPVVGIVAERFAFIASLGLCILASWGILKFLKIDFEEKASGFPSFKGSFGFLIVLFILVFGSMIFVRTDDWKSSYSLYEADAKKATESAHANSLFAAASVQALKQNPGMTDSEKRRHVSNAVKHYKEALRIIPEYRSALNNLGMIYYSYFGNVEGAMKLYKKAVQIDSTYTEAYFNLASCYAKLNDYAAAEKYFLKTLEMDPDFTSSYSSLSMIYSERGRYDLIIELNETAIKKGVKSDIPYVNLANVYSINGDTLKAIPYLEKAIHINPNNLAVNSFLANYFNGKGEFEKANFYFDLMRGAGQK